MAKFRHSEKDYTTDMLPKNRKEVFKDVFKLHFWKLLACGLILFVFALPLHISALVDDFYSLTLQQHFFNGEITQTELAAYYLAFSRTRGIIEIALCILFSLGLSAVTRVIRQLAWEENVFMRYDTVKGIKQNAIQYLFLGLLFGIIRFGCSFFMNALVAKNGVPYVGITISVLSVVLLAPAAIYMIIAICIYGNKFRHNVRLGFVLYFKHPLKTLGVFLACSAIFIPQFIPLLSPALVYVHIIFRIVSSFLSGIILLILFLFVSSVLDRDINPKFHPELIDRGILGKK